MVRDGERLFTDVEGTFYRAVDPAFRTDVLAGSKAAGRYSRAGVPTLYMSASCEGVAAAMIAHAGRRSAALEVVEVEVRATHVFDLRDADACRLAGVAVEDAMAPWQELAATGREPPSWMLRRRLEGLGAQGLIDPSRKAPGLWHLVLFAWNRPGAPTVVAR